MRTKLTIFIYTTLFFLSGNIFAQEWALKFEASDEDSYVDCGFDEALFPANVTFETWVYVDTWVEGGNYVLATESWTEANGPMGYAIRLNPDIGAEFVLGLGANDWGVVASGYESLDSLSWYHLACTFDGSIMIVYLNGEFMLDQEVNGAIFPSDQNLILGEGAAWRGRRFSGKLYDIRIWSVARTEEEINANMNTFLNGDEEGLVANWKADEGTGSLLTDATGNFPASIKSGVEWFPLSATTAPDLKAPFSSLVYPNPAQDFITISNPRNDYAVYSIIDLLGKKILGSNLGPNETARVNVSKFPQGIYFMKFDNVGSSQVEKFIIK